MQLHNLKRRTPNKKKSYVGRGGKRGKTSGKGTKGQNSRAGRKKRPEMRDIIKKIPKLRGRGKNSFLSIQEKPVVINLDVIEKAVKAGDAVSPQYFVEKGLLSKSKGLFPKVKILGNGEITKKIAISDCLVSGSARAKIEKAGGTIAIKA